MAEQINLATFNWNTDKLYDSLIDLKNQMTILKNEQGVLAKGAKELAKEFSATTASMAKLASEGGEATEEYKELESQQKKLYDAMSVQNTLLETTSSNLKMVTNEYKTTSNVLNSITNDENEFSNAVARTNEMLERQNTSIASARASNKEILALRNQLNPALAEEASLIQQLNARLDDNNAFIKENASAYEQQKINIGNYSESIKSAFQDLNIFNGGLGGFIGRAEEAGGVGNLVSGSFKQMQVAIVGATKSAIAFIATPIGAVLAVIAGAFLLVQNAMNRSEESSNKVTKAIAPLVGWFNKMLEILEPLGEFIINGFVVYLDLMEKQLYATFDALAYVLEAVGADEWASGVKDFRNELEATSIASKELADAEAELEMNQRKARLTQLEYQKEAEKFRQIRDDERLAIQERIKANDQLGEVLKKQLQEELRLAQTALTVANLRIKQEGRTKEALDDQYNALTQIADIEERITGQESEQLTNRVALQKEAEQKAKEIRDNAERQRQEAYKREIQRMNEELDLFITQQGERARTLKEELELERLIAKDSIKILDFQLKNKQISRTKYASEVLKIENDLAKRTAELAVENAGREIEEWRKKNESKLELDRFFNEQDLALEQERLDDLKKKEIEFAELQKEQGIINANELNDIKLQIDEDYLLKRDELYKSYEAQRKERELLQASLDFEEKILKLQEDSATEFEIQQEIRNEQRAQELEALQQEAVEKNYSHELYKQAENNINRKYDLLDKEASEQNEKAIFETKLQYAQMALGALGEVIGKETAAGKALAVAQIGINTAMAIVKSYSDLGPILGTVFAAIVGTVGALQIKKVVSTKEPKVDTTIRGFADGGIIDDGHPIRRANGDDVLITAKRGEVILNERHQRMLGGNSTFASIGVPGFATSGIVGNLPSESAIVQNNVYNQMNEVQLSETIANAVMEGARLGSQEGSQIGTNNGLVDASANRQVQQNATF